MDTETPKTNIRSRKSQYNEEEHIDLLEKIMSRMEGVAAFCDEAGISLRTFYDWREKYPNFREAYDILRMRSQRHLEAHLLGNNEINHSTWVMIYRNRCNRSPDRRIVSLQSQSIEDRLSDIQKSFAEGELDIAEYHKLVSALAIETKVTACLASLGKMLGTSIKEIEEMTAEELKEKVDDLYKRLQS
jgi:hypothetical protein